ncbi:MAG: SPOR domain-containing protein [Spirochaetales bacterium]
MEQKKILWIVAAIGVFLLVIFLGTLVMYSPPKNAEPVISTMQVQNDTWVNHQPGKLSQPGGEQSEALDANITAPITIETSPVTQTPETTLQSKDITVISNGNTTVYAKDGVTTIDLTGSTTQSTEKNITQVTNSVQPEPVSTIPPTVTRPVSEEKVSIANTVTSQEPVKSTNVGATLTVTKQTPADQYWVQAASFISKANAENARVALGNEKIPAEIFTHYDSSGVTYYRVRVGPYTTKSEAEYWNSLIKSIDPLSGTQSYVTNSSQPIS